jgi:hypothetical protein
MDRVMKMFELTKEQQKAFNNLKKAFRLCEDKGFMFYNNYGTLGVCDKKKVIDYNDTESPYCDQLDVNNLNEIRLPCNEWSDDPHYFHLAK